MCKLISFLALIFSFSTMAAEYISNQNVLLRVPGTQKITKELRSLKNLIVADAYDGKYFKLVLGKSDDAIPFNHPDAEVRLKAASVYYHLNQARSFFLDVIQTDRPLTVGKLVIRLEITNSFSDLAHFMSDRMEPEYNNALSIPAGTPPDFVPNGKPWGDEIWFRPKKVISTKDLDNRLGPNPLTQALSTVEKPINDFTYSSWRMDTIEAIFNSSARSGYGKDLMWTAGTFAVLKVVIGGSKKMDPLFLNKWYYLDTALVPEVVFHEYAHVILSDKLALSHSTPVIEGMADFFAANIASNSLVYGTVPGHSNARAKDALNKNPYNHAYEHNSQASADFVLSVLWKVKQALPKVSNQLIFNARNFLRTDSSTIHDSLLRALLKSCNQVCENPLRDRNLLYQAFAKKGF